MYVRQLGAEPAPLNQGCGWNTLWAQVAAGIISSIAAGWLIGWFTGRRSR